MRRIITNHYARIGVPEHFWLGVTCEDNRVKRVLDILRATKDRVGDFTAFSSVEPAEAATAETHRMIRWWGVLHAGRSALGLVATLIFLSAQR